MGQTILVKHKQSYDTEENWGNNNPILLPGQLAYSSDKYGKYKIGNGTAHWNDLEYCNDEKLGTTYLPTNSNLNDITTPGFYFNNQNNEVMTFSNCPTENAFFMMVAQHTGKYQELTEYFPTTPKKWFRNSYGNTWGSWYRIYTEADKNKVYQIKSRTALPQSNTMLANVNDYKINYSFININVYSSMPTSTTGELVYSITIPTYLIGSFKKLNLKSGNTSYGTLTFEDGTISIIGQTGSSYDIYGIK